MPLATLRFAEQCRRLDSQSRLREPENQNSNCIASGPTANGPTLRASNPWRIVDLASLPVPLIFTTETRYQKKK